MSFIRKIRRGGSVYLAEVENKWIDGKCVQKHIRYVGKEADGETVLASSLSDAVIDEVKLYGPLLVLNHLATELGLSEVLGPYGNEILSMVYAHCLDYKSINQMERWYSRTDLNMLLGLERVTERRLLEALDSLEQQNSDELQQRIFKQTVRTYKLQVSGVVYDVTNTYLYGKRCTLGKMGHDKEGVKGRPLIQIGLAVTREEGIPICHKVFDGNIHDARTFQDFITYLKKYEITNGLVVYDRGITSSDNIRDMNELHWDTLCGLAIRGNLVGQVRTLISKKDFLNINNRIRVNKSVFYVISTPHTIDGVKGTLAICFNDQQRRELRESRYDEIMYAQSQRSKGKTTKEGLERFFLLTGSLNENEIANAEEFDGYSCIFSTYKLHTSKEIVRLYFEKDVVEKAFRTIKGITRLQPIRHWLYNRVTGHVFICYLSYLLLSLLQHRLRKIDMTAEAALIELDSMYKVYIRDCKKGFEVSRIVALTKQQEKILKTISRNLLKKPSV